ncbi:cytochrome C oxidase subunit II [Paenibacillus nanensis]|uniref:Cytochrome C oxidase subunit II n=1 Tax=Paenibacillus nanensis TaxID=393251 RepID=A0A3A1UWM2_9BACL|nr:cytochrome C oxidase subunit II [Paenibacillus nanensis]RIX52674.1 cytochrome C oxidase subunit II [Paenibacillus nanensis]
MKKWFIFASVFALVLIIAACGSNSGNNGGNSGSASNESAEQAAPTSELVITAKNWEFDQEEYKIKAGEAVGLTLKSVDGVHGLQILKTDYEVGNDKTVTVQFDKPGTYDVICSVPCGPGHRTMTAKLVVE